MTSHSLRYRVWGYAPSSRQICADGERPCEGWRVRQPLRSTLPLYQRATRFGTAAASVILLVLGLPGRAGATPAGVPGPDDKPAGPASPHALYGNYGQYVSRFEETTEDSQQDGFVGADEADDYGVGAEQSGAGHGRKRQIEIDVSGNDGTSVQGEPEIAIDPTNPNNLLMVWTKLARPLNPFGVQPFEQCPVAVSTNGGRSWKLTDQPANHMTIYGCGDGVAAAGPDGTLYAGGGVTTFVGPGQAGPGLAFHGEAVVSSSGDGGQSWSPATIAMGSSDNSRFVSGTPVDPIDREWLAVDQSTGTLYASAANVLDHQRFVTVSTDKAQSFGPIYAVDSPSYPQMSSGTIAAAKGVFAVAYTASAAPGATCPCVIFETSTNDGATFDRHIVPLHNAASSPGPFLAASPVGRGRFAVMVLDSTGTSLQVYVTKNFGETWSGPTLVGEAPANPRFKPWISYSPSGELVVVWRTLHSDGAYDVWSAIGRHKRGNGAVFGAPLRVSSVAAPYPPGGTFGDDFSWVAADHKYVHVGWGDSRSGATQTWYGRIRRTDFRDGFVDDK
jgi:hypothetical protein